MTDLLQIQNVSSGYNGKTVLRNVSIAVGKGEVLAVIGQNGCGKSTLLKTIARIISDNSGDVTFQNMKINNLQPWNMKRLGMTYFAQGGMFFPTMNVSEHFELASKDRSKTDRRAIIDECLSYFPSLHELMDILGGNLSGGQRQMLSFAMLIAQQTHCWLLDEPTAGLAPDRVREAVAFLTEMKERSDKTILLVEHNYQVAFDLADRVAVMKEGEVSNIFSKTEFKREEFLDTYLFS